ncbi:MAG TPA: homoserine dehydrogenase [Candidatus Limnocylindria bacterium]|nr:homoserine dehydrogenase [Candidatus Limnocylindria bacterium]
MERLSIGLIGWGTVGSAFGRLVLEGPLPLELAKVAVRNRDRDDLPEGVAVVTPEEALDADIVVELAGGIDGPRQWAKAALDTGTPYVTANKALLASHGGELAELAERRSAALLASASVGGGTPMIETVQHMAATGDIVRLRGVVNATTTYILSAMGRGASYEDALSDAQAAGYAEADPSFDVEGRDAAQKLAILASVAWGRWRPESDVETEGILETAVMPGQVVRLVADADPEHLRVGPARLEPVDPLAVLEGVESMLEIVSRDGTTVRVSGPGAGGRVTAGAVYADVARLVAGERPILFAAPARRLR